MEKKNPTDEEIRDLIKNGQLWKWSVDGLGWLMGLTSDKELKRRISEYRISAIHAEEGSAGIL